MTKEERYERDVQLAKARRSPEPESSTSAASKKGLNQALTGEEKYDCITIIYII